mgnify:FL=1|tara:strand:- start:961 stop:1737 length:777 start_codon:yes stop_codon:yes gene_type:complete
MSNMKIILETWKRFEESGSCERYSPVILIENNRRTETDFLTLLERKDISESQLTTILTESFDYELALVLKEGMLDNISGFISNTMNKAKALLERGKLQGLILLNKLKDTAAKLQGKHPKIAKAVVILVTAAAAYFLMDFLSGSQAHAVVTDLPLATLEIVAGAADQLTDAAMQAGNMEAAQALEVAVQGLKKGHQIESEMSFSQLIDSLPSNSQEQLQSAIDFVSKLSKEARAEGAGGDAEAILKTARRVGEIILKSK